MTEREAIQAAIDALQSDLNQILSWGPRSPKNIHRNAYSRQAYRELNAARRVLRRMLGSL